MSVLICGMEMPNRCFACPMCIEEDGEWLCNISHGSYLEYMEIPEDIAIDTRPDWCPLVELPPHGRLIDADELRKAMYHEAFEIDSPMQRWDSGCWIRYKMFERAEENAPTIIPADKEAQDNG